MPSLSVVVPIYNVSNNLEQCLSSLISQDYDDVEFICIDDCSTDGSTEILREYAAKDQRITPVFHQENLGVHASRREGALMSTGKYVMFVDGDDELVLGACSALFELGEKSNVDVLHFATQIVNDGGVIESRIAANERLVAPRCELLEGDLIEMCFLQKLFNFSIWGKLFRGDLCRSAFTATSTDVLPKAQDLYETFVVLSFSSSYLGVEDLFYRYHFGIGITGADLLTVQQYDRIATQGLIPTQIQSFLETRGELQDRAEALDAIKNRLIDECVTKFGFVAEGEGLEAFEALAEYWPMDEVIAAFARRMWSSAPALMRRIEGCSLFGSRTYSKQRKTIAIYYRCIENGGAQRVVARLCNIWSKLQDESGQWRYDVVLITDDIEVTAEYPLDSRVVHEYVPDRTASHGKNYQARMHAFMDIIERRNIDVVVYAQWVDACLPWDMLSIKATKRSPAFCIQSHSFNPIVMEFVNDAAARLRQNYRFCDGVALLSDCDQSFAKLYNPRTKAIANPLTYDPAETPRSDLSSNNMLWVGRFSKEKNPLYAVEVFAEVKPMVPGVTMTMVGDGPLLNDAMELSELLELGDSIRFPGFCEDMQPFYENASLFLSTSDYEGFPMGQAEALCFGLPLATDKMPWLTMHRDGRGYLFTDMGEISKASTDIAALLNDEEELRRLSDEAHSHAMRYEESRLIEDWETFFDSLSVPISTNESDEETNDYAILIDGFIDFHSKKSVADAQTIKKLRSDLRKTRNQLKKTKSSLKRTKKKLNDTYTGPSWKIGRVITALPRLVKKRIK